MRINIYTEELLTSSDNVPMCEIVTAKYISSRTGQEMINYGLRVFVKSPPELHYIPGRDDDRSAVTFWVGSKANNLTAFLEVLKEAVNSATLREWHDKTLKVQAEADEAII